MRILLSFILIASVSIPGSSLFAEHDPDETPKSASDRHIDWLPENNASIRIRKRFPDLCKRQRKIVSDTLDEVQFRINLMEIQSKEGIAGLRKAYPEFLKKHPDAISLTHDYAEFLIQERRFENARVHAQKKLKLFPGDLKLTLILEHLNTHNALSSEAQKEVAITEMKKDLNALINESMACVYEE